MLTNFNNSISDDVRRILNIKNGVFLSPDVSKNIVLIKSVETPINGFGTNQANTSGGGNTVYTTPTDKDFYLTHLQMGISKSAACDATTGQYNITGTVSGQTVYLGRISIVTLTAQEYSVEFNWETPIKLDRNTTIVMSAITFSAGTCNRHASVFGYISNTGG